MKLYNVQDGSTVKLLEDAVIPPGAPEVNKGDVVKLFNIDGVYGNCFKDGERVWIHAMTEVEEVVENPFAQKAKGC